MTGFEERRALLLVASLGLVVGTTGCAGDSPGGGGPTYPGPFGDVLDSLCGVLDRCPDALGQPIAYRSREECRAILGWATTCRAVQVGEGLDFELVQTIPELDAETAQACTDWLATATCEDFADLQGSPCGRTFGAGDGEEEAPPPALGGEGEACTEDEGCLDGLFCTDPTSDRATGTVTCRVCRPRLASGEACTRTAMCAGELYCRFDEAAGSSSCVAPEADGTPCTADEQCAAGFCNVDLDPSRGGWGLCDPDGGHEGDPCMWPGACRAPLSCVDSICGVPGLGNGAACAENDDCAADICDAGQCGYRGGTPCTEHAECASAYCDRETGACSEASTPRCGDGSDCPTGQLCDGESGECREPAPDGASCDDDEECFSGWCSPTAGACRERPGIGDPCASTLECGRGAYCDGSACVARHAPGEACDAQDSCVAPFWCNQGRCDIIDLTCTPASAGETCTSFVVCDDHAYCDLADNFTCKPRIAAGQPCEPSIIPGVEVCALDHTCDEATRSCVALPGLGDACTDRCVEGAYCSASVCVEAPPRVPCDHDAEPACPAETFCDSGLDLCVPRRPADARCDETAECQDGLYCGDGSRCSVRLGADERCNQNEECQSALHCSTGTATCQPDHGLGAACDPHAGSCAAGTYCDSVTSTCTSLVGVGGDCSEDEQCESGACTGAWCRASAQCAM